MNDTPPAESWWGQAWTRALEATPPGHAPPDPERLARGRTYARGGYVEGLTATPGRVTGAVRGSRPRPYRAEIRLRELADEEWDLFLDAVAAEPAHTAALLDRDLPRLLVRACEEAGVHLLPTPGEARPHCTCPDRGHPCKHAAALGYRTARLLDGDPFVLLLLRGRREEEVVEELAHRSAATAAGAARADEHRAVPALPTVSARDAVAGTTRPSLPDPLPPPPVPGEPPPYPDAPGAEAAATPRRTGHRRTARAGGHPAGPGPLDPESLAFLATDAASRAHAYLTGAGPDPLQPRRDLTPWQDAVRLAATHPRLTGRGTFSSLAARLARATGGVHATELPDDAEPDDAESDDAESDDAAGPGATPAELARAAAAWRQGAEAGLAALQTAWDPPAGDFDRARSALAVNGWPRMAIHRNRLTQGPFQLRYGQDGRWYPYLAGPGSDHWPEGPSSGDPVRALRGLPGR